MNNHFGARSTSLGETTGFAALAWGFIALCAVSAPIAQAQRAPRRPAVAQPNANLSISSFKPGSIEIAQYKPVQLPAAIAARASKPMKIAQLPTRNRFLKPSGKATSNVGKFGDLPIKDPNVPEKAKNLDVWFENMPEWGKKNPAKLDKTDKKEYDPEIKVEDNRSYETTRTDYSIVDTPNEIVTFAPVNGFWLGGMVQQTGLSLGLGSLQEIPVPNTKRAPFNVSSSLPMANNFRKITGPSVSKVGSAIGDLMQKGGNSGWGGARTLKIVDNFSENQTAFEIGLDARYAIAEIKASFSSERRASNHTITAAFTERAFTVQADFEGRSRRTAFFNDAFTLADAKLLYAQGKITGANLPAYIKSITYGRIVLFNLTSRVSESEMRAAVNASVSGASWHVKPSYSGSEKMKNEQFDLRVTTLGGPQSGFTQLIPAKGMTDVLAVMDAYLKQPAPLSTMMPISYTANTVRDDQLAALSTTTDYTVTKYVPKPIGERYKLKMWIDVIKKPDDGVADHTFESYGYLRVNGDTWWELPNNGKSNAKHGQNAVVKISEDEAYRKKEFTYNYFYDTKKPFTFTLLMMDWDKASSNDPWMKVEKTLDLKEWANKTYTFEQGAGRLTIVVERTDFL